jgi:ribonuclease BN (tRNA processing enzyme)
MHGRASIPGLPHEELHRVKVELIESAIGGDRENHYLTSLVVDEVLAVDIGGLGFSGDLAKQQKIRDVVFTHAHFDHIASLPFFLENVYKTAERPVRLHASRHVLDVLQRHVFNDELWPDFFNLGEGDDRFCALRTLDPEVPVRVGPLEVTPAEVTHPVPTFGFLVSSPGASVVIAPDTGPTERLWELARDREDLKAVFLDASFPAAYTWLADVSQHLTPALFAREIEKIGRPVPVYAIHLKARFRAEIERELERLALPALAIARPGEEVHL